LVKGVREERELVNLLDSLGFAVLRAPASGSKTKLDRPDILAGRKGFIMALEVKSTSKRTFYIREESLAQLKRFSEKFGAKPFLAVKFKYTRKGWLLINVENIELKGKSFKLSFKEALKKGLTPEMLITKNLKTFLGSNA
jgi:Holliday junction resolvase